MTLDQPLIKIDTYSAEEGTVNGEVVARGQYATIHQACVALAVGYAQRASAPVFTHAVDTIGAPAEYWMHVHPDGSTMLVDNAIPAADGVRAHTRAAGAHAAPVAVAAAAAEADAEAASMPDDRPGAGQRTAPNAAAVVEVSPTPEVLPVSAPVPTAAAQPVAAAQPAAAARHTITTQPGPASIPTLKDLLDARPPRPAGPAQTG